MQLLWVLFKTTTRPAIGGKPDVGQPLAACRATPKNVSDACEDG